MYIQDEVRPNHNASGILVRQGGTSHSIISKFLLDDLATRIRGLSIGPEVRPPSTAILLPLKSVAEDHIQGVLIIGLSTHGIFDTPYREFLELVVDQVD